MLPIVRMLTLHALGWAPYLVMCTVLLPVLILVVCSGVSSLPCNVHCFAACLDTGCVCSGVSSLPCNVHCFCCLFGYWLCVVDVWEFKWEIHEGFVCLWCVPTLKALHLKNSSVRKHWQKSGGSRIFWHTVTKTGWNLSYQNFQQNKNSSKQECIPVGCVPPAAVAVCWGIVCISACWDTPPRAWAWTPPELWATPPGLGLDPPGVGLDTPIHVGLDPPARPPTSPWVWALDPPDQTPNLPLGSGPRHPPARPPTFSWAWV